MPDDPVLPAEFSASIRTLDGGSTPDPRMFVRLQVSPVENP